MKIGVVKNADAAVRKFAAIYHMPDLGLLYYCYSYDLYSYMFCQTDGETASASS